MNDFEATSLLVQSLEDCGIPYMLVGSFSRNAYGVMRSTKDADM